jgi:aminoglycoside phosphotransferase
MIASGVTAEVFPYSPGWVLKLFHVGLSADFVCREQRSAQVAYALSVNNGVFQVPRVGEIIHINKRFGLLYEFIPGAPMLATLLASSAAPLDLFAKQLAELHASLHNIAIDRFAKANVLTPHALPTQQSRLTHAIQKAQGISNTQRAAALLALHRQTRVATSLCHGDFHMGNILLDPTKINGATLIDWRDASIGDPLADVARTSLLICFAVVPKQVELDVFVPAPALPWQQAQNQQARQHFNQLYLHHYRALTGQGTDWHDALSAWLPILAIARLSETANFDERARLLELIAEHYSGEA